MLNVNVLPCGLRLPAQCVLCCSSHRKAGLLCDDCIVLLPEIKACCEYCAIPLADVHSGVCGQCLQLAAPFMRVWARYHYDSLVKGLLHRYKYHSQLHLAALFCQLMLAKPPPFVNVIDAIIPVPVHPYKLRERGFNPVAVIARRLARSLQRPCLLFHCRKIRSTPSQALLDKQQRMQNLQGSFACKNLSEKRIVLVDDLMTTGSTLQEVSRVLLESGAKEVYGWCLARAGDAAH